MMVYDRCASKADDLVELGARFMEPQNIAKEADFVFMMLGNPQVVDRISIVFDN